MNIETWVLPGSHCFNRMANSLKNIILLVFFLFSQITKGQNLIPNPGFDSLQWSATCPTWGGYAQMMDLLTGWTDNGSADWFSTCRPVNPTTPPAPYNYSYHVPNNLFGFENAHSDSSYVGMGTFVKDVSMYPNFREFIKCALLTELNVGQEYCISLYISLADSVSYACNNLGVFFSANYITGTLVLIDSVPQIEFNSTLENKIGWTHLSKSFIANGTERYMTIGNFKDDAHSDTVYVGSQCTTLSEQTINVAYYFLDDVTLTPVNYFKSKAGKDTTICLNEQVQIGDSLHIGCIYRWSPAIGLSDTTVAQPIASPSQTTTYILNLTDTNITTECAEWHTTTDSVTITVIPLSDAGSDQQICEGYNMQIGTSEVTGVTYEWNPQVYLSNYSAAQPFASPPQTMSYVLTVSDSLLSSHCRTSDTVMVGVIPCVNEISVYPNPNNGSFILEYNLSNASSATFYIYNVLGQKVYSSLLPTTSSKGERVEITTPFSTGVYFWQVESGEKKIAIGKIVIID